jgi:hypothetical protein
MRNRDSSSLAPKMRFLDCKTGRSQRRVHNPEIEFKLREIYEVSLIMKRSHLVCLVGLGQCWEVGSLNFHICLRDDIIRPARFVNVHLMRYYICLHNLCWIPLHVRCERETVVWEN